MTAPTPELPTLLDPSTLVRKGLCPVAQTRAVQSHNLYYELHGAKENVQTRILFIMGLNNTCFGWSRQVEYFSRKEGTQTLVFDNRGVGNSDLASGLYRTSEMAKDVVDLLDYLEWTERNSVDVVGVSMGGMITQHLVLDVPDRISSILLLSTKTSHKPDLPPLQGIQTFVRLIGFGRLIPESRRISILVDGLFPSSYLDVPYSGEDPDGSKKGKTVREVVNEDFMHRFTVARKQPVKGSLAQVGAAVGHRITAEDCQTISKNVGKVMIVAGDQDALIHHHRSYDMEKMFPGSELVMMKDVGHAIPYQCPDELNKLIERTVSEGRANFSATA